MLTIATHCTLLITLSSYYQHHHDERVDSDLILNQSDRSKLLHHLSDSPVHRIVLHRNDAGPYLLAQ